MTHKVFYAKSLRNVPSQAPETVSPDDYQQVAEVSGDLEEVFRQMNAVDGNELCCQLRVRSMSVGDIAVDAAGVAHYCQGAGWGRTTFSGDHF